MANDQTLVRRETFKPRSGQGRGDKGGNFFCRVIFMMGVAIFSDVFCPVKGRGKYSYSGHAFWVKRFLATLENPSSLVCF